MFCFSYNVMGLDLLAGLKATNVEVTRDAGLGSEKVWLLLSDHFFEKYSSYHLMANEVFCGVKKAKGKPDTGGTRSSFE